MNYNLFLNYVPRMQKKVSEGHGSKFKVVAMAFTKKGNLLGISTNGFREGLSNRRGSGEHAEMKLIKKFGERIDRIYLIRFGRSLLPLPIHSCENCSKVCNKLGIRVISLHEEIDLLNYIK